MRFYLIQKQKIDTRLIPHNNQFLKPTNWSLFPLEKLQPLQVEIIPPFVPLTNCVFILHSGKFRFELSNFEQQNFAHCTHMLAVFEEQEQEQESGDHWGPGLWL